MSLAISNQVAILDEGEGGGGGDEVATLGLVLTRDTLLTMHELDRKKTCQFLRNLLHDEGVAVSIQHFIVTLIFIVCLWFTGVMFVYFR